MPVWGKGNEAERFDRKKYIEHVFNEPEKYSSCPAQ